jgi:hypothetical protein
MILPRAFGLRRPDAVVDPEDIPQMRALQDIDAAFVCFNLPHTMTEEQAASAVRDLGRHAAA